MEEPDENAAMVNALQRHSAVIVQKSLEEGFGLTVVEAMWKARPIVASAVGGIPEVVADGRTGLLVPYDAADPTAFEGGLAARIGELLADPPRAAAMGTAGRERVLAEFGWPAVARETVELYSAVLAAQG
jgi:starch synthase